MIGLKNLKKSMKSKQKAVRSVPDLSSVTILAELSSTNAKSATTSSGKRKSKKKAAKKNSKPSIIHFLKNKLRRASYQWSPMREVVQNARVERGRYKCAGCGGIFGPKEINRDHIEPVEDPHAGWQGWDVYISRLFCGVEGLQVLCSATCHKSKTDRENMIRKMVKKEKNEQEEDI